MGNIPSSTTETETPSSTTGTGTATPSSTGTAGVPVPRTVALCFRNNDTSLKTLLAVTDPQGLLADTIVKSKVTNGSFGYDCVYEIRDTQRSITDTSSRLKYKLYKIFHKGYCLGKCRRPSSTNDPEWCLKGTSEGGKLFCGTDPGDSALARFYFKDGIMKCSGDTSLNIPIDIYSINENTPGNFTINSLVSVSDYEYIPTTRLFSATSSDDPKITKTNYNSVFGMDTRNAQSCSFSNPSIVPQSSSVAMEYLNVKFNNLPVWSKRQTGDVRILRNLSRNRDSGGDVLYMNSHLFYYLELDGSKRIPSKIVVFLEDGCHANFWLWNKGGNGTWNWTNINGATELDMTKYNYETIGTPVTQGWFGTNNGKKAFVLNLPTLTRNKTQFAIEINNDKNSSMYGIQFMFMDADGQIVDKGSDLLQSNPDKFLCYDQLIRLWGDTFKQATLDGRGWGYGGLYMGNNNNDQNEGSMLLRSYGWIIRDANISNYAPQDYFIYNPQSQRLIAVHDGEKEADVIIAPRGNNVTRGTQDSYGPNGDNNDWWAPQRGNIPNEFYLHAFLDSNSIGDEGRWIIDNRIDAIKEVTFKNKLNTNMYISVKGGGNQWGWDVGSRIMLVYDRPDQHSNGLIMSPSLTRRIQEINRP